MNYRHIYHAGNICDVVKHAVLMLWLKRLMEKDTAVTLFDTHAGCGLYDLKEEAAEKTREAAAGIQKLAALQTVPSVLSPYMAAVRAVNDGGALRHYPGSPCLMRSVLRPQDHMVLCEKHPDDARTLKHRFYNDAQVHTHERDGYEGLTALTPPATKRGFVLIDPPFEERDEFDRLTTTLKTVHKRWAIGSFMLWYPLKDRPTLWAWHEALATLPIPRMLAAEFLYAPETRADRLVGSGLILVQPPWKLDEEIAILFNELHGILATESQESRLNWLTSP